MRVRRRAPILSNSSQPAEPIRFQQLSPTYWRVAMNHFGVALGAITATVIGGAIVLDQVTSSPEIPPAESNVSATLVKGEAVVADTATSVSAPIDSRVLEPAPPAKLANPPIKLASAPPARPRV